MQLQTQIQNLNAASKLKCRTWMQLECSRNAAGMQLKCSWNAAGMQLECSWNTASNSNAELEWSFKTQMYSWNAAGMQLECSTWEDSPTCGFLGHGGLSHRGGPPTWEDSLTWEDSPTWEFFPHGIPWLVDFCNLLIFVTCWFLWLVDAAGMQLECS